MELCKKNARQEKISKNGERELIYIYWTRLSSVVPNSLFAIKAKFFTKLLFDESNELVFISKSLPNLNRGHQI